MPLTNVVMETSRGTIRIELDGDGGFHLRRQLPVRKEKFYDNTIFHRVIPGFMIQGGGFRSRLAEEGYSPIKNEAPMGELSNIARLDRHGTHERSQQHHRPVLYQRGGQLRLPRRGTLLALRSRHRGVGGRGRHRWRPDRSEWRLRRRTGR